MSGDARREQILDTAVEVFSKYGFNGSTTKKVAEAAGVSEAIIFRHFDSKDDLYAAILHRKVCEGGEHQFPWEGNPDLAAAMAAKDDHQFFYLLALVALRKHHEDSGFMRLLFYSALEEHDLADRFILEVVEGLYRFLGGYIEMRQKDGAMRNINPRIAVRAFMGMLIHHSLNNILWDRKRVLLDITIEEAARNFADILLDGITA